VFNFEDRARKAGDEHPVRLLMSIGVAVSTKRHSGEEGGHWQHPSWVLQGRQAGAEVSDFLLYSGVDPKLLCKHTPCQRVRMSVNWVRYSTKVSAGYITCLNK